jgi:hypothetical protein
VGRLGSRARLEAMWGRRGHNVGNAVAPGSKRVLVILSLDYPDQLPFLRVIEAAAPVFGVQIVTVDSNAARAINTFAQEPNSGLIVFFWRRCAE